MVNLQNHGDSAGTRFLFARCDTHNVTLIACKRRLDRIKQSAADHDDRMRWAWKEAVMLWPELSADAATTISLEEELEELLRKCERRVRTKYERIACKFGEHGNDCKWSPDSS